MKKPTPPQGPLECDVGWLLGIVPAAIRAQKLMDQAADLSTIALDAAAAGRGREANVISAEAAKRRREARALLEPYKPPNAGVKRLPRDAD